MHFTFFLSAKKCEILSQDFWAYHNIGIGYVVIYIVYIFKFSVIFASLSLGLVINFHRIYFVSFTSYTILKLWELFIHFQHL